MCGIVGLIHSDPEVARRGVRAGSEAIAHRGPDDADHELVAFGDRWLGLGHRRLSILDLSPLGHQPMAHEASGCRLIYNGEIYNFRRLRAELERLGHRFRGGTDTEVLLAGLVQHGEAFLNRLEGMYAFGFYDPRQSTLLLARDPAGIKPLYLAETDDGVAFGSEVRALLATGLIVPKLDRRGVAGYLAYGAVQHPLTLFEGVSTLPPGARLVMETGRGQRPTWSAPEYFWQFPPANPHLTESFATSAVRETLDAAVGDHLVADVPVGVFLSSGIDSTIIGGLAARRSADVQSFTIVFDDSPEFSEQRLAAESAKIFGLDHTEIPLSAAAAESAMSDWLATLDQPSIDGLNVFVISRAVRERGVKVALSGLGADELFGGYPSFRDVPRLGRLTRLARPFSARLRSRIADVATVGRSAAVRSKTRDMFDGNVSLRSTCLRRRRVISNQQLERLGVRATELALDDDFLAPAAAVDIDSDVRDPLRVISQIEFRGYQGNTLLRDADANGMAFGLEIRVPFLDRRLLDLAHSIPGSVRLPPRRHGKHLLRKAFGDLVRPSILDQKKKGFSLPIRRWMTGPVRPVCEQALEALADTRLLNPDGISSLWSSFLREAESPMWSRAFALVVLGEFCRKTGAVV